MCLSFDDYFLYVFIWLPQVLVVAGKIFVVSCKIFAVHGLSSCGMWALEHAGSGVMAHRLNCSMACGILVSWPGIEPTSPAL